MCEVAAASNWGSDAEIFAASFSPPKSVALLAAAIRYNNLSEEEGFDEFAGEDGSVSLDTFLIVVKQLQLGIDNGGAHSLFRALDVNRFVRLIGWSPVY